MTVLLNVLVILAVAGFVFWCYWRNAVSEATREVPVPVELQILDALNEISQKLDDLLQGARRESDDVSHALFRGLRAGLNDASDASLEAADSLESLAGLHAPHATDASTSAGAK